MSFYGCALIAEGFNAGALDLAWYGNVANPNGAYGDLMFVRTCGAFILFTYGPDQPGPIDPISQLPYYQQSLGTNLELYLRDCTALFARQLMFVNIYELLTHATFSELLGRLMYAQHTIEHFIAEYRAIPWDGVQYPSHDELLRAPTAGEMRQLYAASTEHGNCHCALTTMINEQAKMAEPSYNIEMDSRPIVCMVSGEIQQAAQLAVGGAPRA
jgi:hypothetical protein